MYLWVYIASFFLNLYCAALRRSKARESYRKVIKKMCINKEDKKKKASFFCARFRPTSKEQQIEVALNNLLTINLSNQFALQPELLFTTANDDGATWYA